MAKILLVVDQGSYYTSSIDLTDENNNPLNVSGYTANATIRKHYYSVDSVSFTTTLLTGLLQIELSANTTNAMEPGRYVYDIELIPPSGKPARIAEGPLILTPGV